MFLHLLCAICTFCLSIALTGDYRANPGVDLETFTQQPEFAAMPSQQKLEPTFERSYPSVGDTEATNAGYFEVIETDFFKWKLALDGKELMAGEGLPPHINQTVTKKVSSFDEVIVLTQETGTFCEFGRFWFLGLRSDGSYRLSKPIGQGFAYLPDVTATKDYVKVRIRGGRVVNWEGYLPGGEWTFRDGTVQKTR